MKNDSRTLKIGPTYFLSLQRMLCKRHFHYWPRKERTPFFPSKRKEHHNGQKKTKIPHLLLLEVTIWEVKRKGGLRVTTPSWGPPPPLYTSPNPENIQMRFTSAISTSREYKFCSDTCLVATLSRSKWAVKWRLTGRRDFPVELKTITGWGKCDIRNNQGLEKCYQQRPKHLPRPWPFQTSQKIRKIVLLHTVLKKVMTNA